MYLEIDAREPHRRREKAYSWFKDKGVQSDVKQLPVGDFVLDKKVCFEYKTAEDFIASVKNKRIFKQCKRMQQYPFKFVVIVGDVFKKIKENYKWNPYSMHPFTNKSFFGALATIFDFDVKVVQVETMEQAFYMMWKISQVLLENNKDRKAIDRPISKMTNPIATFLACIEDIGISKATLIANELKLEKLEDLLDLDMEQLTSIKGIGSKTAKKILTTVKGE